MEATGTLKRQETAAVAGTEKRCYTAEDLQIILGIARGAAYKLLEWHEFRWFRIESTYRIPKKSFDEWLDSRLQSVKDARSIGDILTMETGTRYDLTRL